MSAAVAFKNASITREPYTGAHEVVYCDTRIGEDYAADTRGVLGRFFNSSSVQKTSDWRVVRRPPGWQAEDTGPGGLARDALEQRLIARQRTDGAWDIFINTRVTALAGGQDARDKGYFYVDMYARGLGVVAAAKMIKDYDAETERGPAPPEPVSGVRLVRPSNG